MTAINAKNEALVDLRDLCSEELDAVSGGWFFAAFANYEQMKASETFARALKDANRI